MEGLVGQKVFSKVMDSTLSIWGSKLSQSGSGVWRWEDERNSIIFQCKALPHSPPFQGSCPGPERAPCSDGSLFNSISRTSIWLC